MRALAQTVETDARAAAGTAAGACAEGWGLLLWQSGCKCAAFVRSLGIQSC